MIKEFEINDILNAVSSISKIERKKSKERKIKDSYSTKDNSLNPENKKKLIKKEILILDQMIE